MIAWRFRRWYGWLRRHPNHHIAMAGSGFSCHLCCCRPAETLSR
jgi:hypothetical protein